MEGTTPKAAGCAVEPVEMNGVGRSFSIASLPLEESLNDSTPSHVYGRGFEDTRTALLPYGVHR